MSLERLAARRGADAGEALGIRRIEPEADQEHAEVRVGGGDVGRRGARVLRAVVDAVVDRDDASARARGDLPGGFPERKRERPLALGIELVDDGEDAFRRPRLGCRQHLDVAAVGAPALAERHEAEPHARRQRGERLAQRLPREVEFRRTLAADGAPHGARSVEDNDGRPVGGRLRREGWPGKEQERHEREEQGDEETAGGHRHEDPVS